MFWKLFISLCTLKQLLYTMMQNEWPWFCVKRLFKYVHGLAGKMYYILPTKYWQWLKNMRNEGCCCTTWFIMYVRICLQQKRQHMSDDAVLYGYYYCITALYCLLSCTNILYFQQPVHLKPTRTDDYILMISDLKAENFMANRTSSTRGRRRRRRSYCSITYIC